MRWGWLVVAAVVFAHGTQVHAQEPESKPLTVEECVRVAVAGSAKVEEAQAKVHEFEARLNEVQSVYYPKIFGMAYAAPMYTVNGTGYQDNFVVKWKSINDWGPYTYLEALLALPLYSFGRVEAGAEAARHRADVERARVREASNMVALETKRMYYTHLYALSMLPALNNADKILAEARAKGQALYDAGSGDVTQVDLAKLTYGASELTRYKRMAADGAALAMTALKHTMGLPDEVMLQIADKTLPGPADEEAPVLITLMEQAARERPEWAQIEHGRKASLRWHDAERLANWPIVFVAGQLKAGWAPTRMHDANPWHYDVYNTLTGGAVLGVKFDLDPALAAAKAEVASATQEQVEALARFAATGIPLQVRKAFDDMSRARVLTDSSNDGVVATRKWMTFAAAAYTTGTGEARDLLEGLVAFLQAKRTYFENLQAYHTARAELAYAVGEQ